jgi:hypothetical protein
MGLCAIDPEEARLAFAKTVRPIERVSPWASKPIVVDAEGRAARAGNLRGRGFLQEEASYKGC